MLVICEECAKKYNIDETRMKGDRARFTCRQCGHLVIVEKPASRKITPTDPGSSDDGEKTDRMKKEDQKEDVRPVEDASSATQEGKKEDQPGTVPPRPGRGVPVSIYLLLALFAGVLSVTGAVGYISMKYIPQLINDQVQLRTAAIAMAFKGSVAQSFLRHNNLEVEKETERISRLPGVAYAAVVDSRDTVVAGFFSDPNRFAPEFATRIREKGFPESIIRQNRLKPGQRAHDARLLIGGQKIRDRVVALDASGYTIHVGIYSPGIDRTIREALLSPPSLSLLGLILSSGVLVFLLLARSISRPLQELTEVVNRISLGEVELAVHPKGPREVRELALAFERMRYSIKAAIERLRSR
ncbi:HAMP domain-containing protein [Desulfolithobacter sp.]